MRCSLTVALDTLSVKFRSAILIGSKTGDSGDGRLSSQRHGTVTYDGEIRCHVRSHTKPKCFVTIDSHVTSNQNLIDGATEQVKVQSLCDDRVAGSEFVSRNMSTGIVMKINNDE